MKIKFIIILLISFTAISANASSDSTKATLWGLRPKTISLRGESGAMLKTIGFLRNSPYHSNYKTFSLRVGIGQPKGSWQESFYHNSTFGVGLSTLSVADKEHIGLPVTAFFYYNANLWKFSEKFSLDYELNLGPSFGWTPYDPFTNPDNLITDSHINVYAGLQLMLNWRISNSVSVKAGGTVTHYSNGSSDVPCKGLNNIGGFVDVSYTFQPKKKLVLPESEISMPEHKATLEHQIQFIAGTRQITINELPKPDCYIEHDFQVLGVNYAVMVNRNRRFRWGLSADIIYDESANAKTWSEVLESNGKPMTRVEMAPFAERITVGVSIKGELVNPYYTLFANIGYNVISSHKIDQDLFQMIGVKANLGEKAYVLFGVKAMQFGKAEYMFWGVGLRLNDKLPKFLKKRR